MKRKLALILVLAMVLTAFAGCQTKSNVVGGNTASNNQQSSNDNNTIQTKPQDIRLLLMSTNEQAGNVLRDQLVKAGFNVILNIQPDYSSYVAVMEGGDYDLAISGWTTVTGNPDYAVRSIFKTGGDYNRMPLSDSVIDELIDKAAAETPDVYAKTYKELEDRLVTEKAYIIPMFSSLRMSAMNKNIVDVSTFRLSKSRSTPWEEISYVDKSLNETRPLIMTQAMSTLTSMHPIRGNDGSINSLNTNLYVRLVNLTDEDEVISDGSLSYKYAIAEGNQEYYFLLRDDINFAKVENMKAVDTGVKVGAEDVKFTLDLARDKDSVPTHKTYTLHESMQNIEVFTDMEDLKSAKLSGSDKTIFDALNEAAPSAIQSLEADKTAVDNKAGKYQIIKITTTVPFPQVLNFLAHQSAGVVSKEQVTAINSKVDMKSYDPTKDILYGDQSVVTEGSTYDNHLWLSGPYAMIIKNDYEVKFEKNPVYMKGTQYEPKIKDIVYKFIKDDSSATASLRSEEIDIMPFIAENSVDLVTNDDRFHVIKRSSNGTTYAEFNLKEGRSEYVNEDLRKAVLYSVSQNDYIAVYNGLKGKLYSPLSTIIDTGNVLVQDLNKSKEYLAKYQVEKNK